MEWEATALGILSVSLSTMSSVPLLVLLTVSWNCDESIDQPPHASHLWLAIHALPRLDIPTANEGAINGGRVSFLDINAKTRELVDAGLAYKLIRARDGNIVRSSSDLDFSGIDRLCSAQFCEKGTYGLASDIFFTGEETDGGTEFAVNAVNGHMYAVPWMGRAAWESEYLFLCCLFRMVSGSFSQRYLSLNARIGVTMFDQPDADHIAVLIGDDRGTYSFCCLIWSSRSISSHHRFALNVV
jgi:hypothetical protein